MKKIRLLFAGAALLTASCNNKQEGPDVSGIKIDLSVERFDKDFFGMDTLAPDKSLAALNTRYPAFLPIFINNILGLDPLRNDPTKSQTATLRFLALTKPIYDSVTAVFPDTDPLQAEFKNAFRHVKKYFPAYKLPDKIITLVGPIDGLAKMGTESTPDFIGPDFLGISLQFYLGKNFSAYNDEYFITNVAPQYRSRRFEKQYIVADALKLVVDDLFPDQSAGKPLIEQILEKGKQAWLLDQFLPGTADSLKTGYTQKQLEWCRINEGLIWNYIVTNENLYTVDPVSIQQYIGEAPFTQNMTEASPGNIGAWVGRQIVKKYAEKNSALSPEEIMKSAAKKILEEAKYKPK